MTAEGEEMINLGGVGVRSDDPVLSLFTELDVLILRETVFTFEEVIHCPKGG